MLTTAGLFGGSYTDLNFLDPRSGNHVKYEIASGYILYVIAMFCVCFATAFALMNLVKHKEPDTGEQAGVTSNTELPQSPAPSRHSVQPSEAKL